MNIGCGKYKHDDEFADVDDRCVPSHQYINSDDREPLRGFWDTTESRRCRQKNKERLLNRQATAKGMQAQTTPPATV